METHSLNFLSNHKLINFNVPKYLINNFDNLVRFKRVSRTSMLIHLMETYIRLEKKRMEDDNSLNLMIKNVEQRNRESLKNQMIGLKKVVEDDYEPPMIPISDDHLSADDWSNISGVEDLRKL